MDAGPTGKNFILFGEIAVVIVILVVFIFSINSAPKDFPVDIVLTISKGETLSSTATILKGKGIIKSEFWFKSFSYILMRGKIMAGDYYLQKSQNLFQIVSKLANGEYDLITIKVLIPEGLDVKEIADILVKKIPSFDKKTFLKLATPKEGYLFPDTYNFLPNQSVADIISIMENTFTKRLDTVNSQIIAFKKPISDVIKMASILEGEARTTETREIIAGILWKRISLKMPLQVDVSFKYINGKGTFDITPDDLKIDSPYNSYTHLGLPPTPISNPGLDAIISAVTPTKTKYLYFIADKDGNMHYAVTYLEHLANIEKYLK